mgnify:CR=1 FL=1
MAKIVWKKLTLPGLLREPLHEPLHIPSSDLKPYTLTLTTALCLEYLPCDISSDHQTPCCVVDVMSYTDSTW